MKVHRLQPLYPPELGGWGAQPTSSLVIRPLPAVSRYLLFPYPLRTSYFTHYRIQPPSVRAEVGSALPAAGSAEMATAQ